MPDQESELLVPDDTPEVVSWREATAKETPRGAATIANAARKAGWDVVVGYARGPWMTGKESEDDEVEAGICEYITVQGRKPGTERFRAVWHRKLWTKDGAAGDYKFAGGCTWPAIKGAMFATKAKKDQHPENIGAETVGGLKNSKTINAYIKQGDGLAEKEN